HYFDWLLAALDAASLDQLPLWLLLLQIHWDELVQTRPCGRRLTHLLLDKLHHAASRDDGDVLGPLRARMAQLLRPLVTARPENLVAPHTWAKYASTLHAHLDRADARGQRAFQDLARRNERLAPSPPSSTLVEAAESQLYRLLDAAHPTVHPDLLYDQCLALVPDPLRMLHALWDWMSSPFRHGLARVYRAVRLTRHCHQLGLDTDGAIVTFLASRRTLPCTKANVYLAVSELARSRHFSVGAYLQWLITHGVVDRFRALDPDAPCEIRLLAELPLHGLPPHLRNLRRMLLARLDFAADDEATVIARAELEFLVQLTDLPASHYDASRELSSDDALDLARVSRTVRSELSRSIRLRVAQHVVKGDPVGPANWKDLTVEAGTSAISITDLTRVRQALEQMQDFSILADVLKLVATSNNATVLASVVDTLNYHVDIFAAMGAVDDIFGDVLDRHHALKARKAADKGLLVALTEVAAQLPGRRETHLLLASEVQRHHRKSVVAAYSPVSDHTTDALQSADSDFHDELERLLSSGTSMDKPTLTRMFATVMSRVEVAWADASARNLACALLSSRLRTFDPATYDERMEHWLDALVRRDSRPDLSQSWFPLMVTGCLTAKAAVAASTRFLATPQQGPARARQTRVALETLRFVVWDSDPLQPDVAAPVRPSDAWRGIAQLTRMQDRYRFRVQRRAFTTAHPLQFLAIIRQSLESLAGESDATLRGDLDRLLEQESLLGTLRMMIVHHTSQVYAELVTPVLNGPASALPWLRRLADRLFDGSSGIGFTDMDADLEMARVVHAVGTLSLPFCQLKLQLTLNAVPSANPSSMAADRRGLVQEFLTAIDGIGDEDNDSWFDLLTKLDDDTAGSICELAEHSLLDRAVLSNAHSPVKADAAAVHRYLLLVQMTAHGISKSSAATIVSTLADRLEIVLRYVGRVRGQRGEEMADDTASAGASRLERRAAAMTSIVILLHLIVIHKDDLVPSANRSAASSAVASGARCRILDCLRAILQRPALCDSVEIHEFVFDLTGWLLDALSSLETPTSTVTSPRLLHHKAAAATEASPPANIDGSTTSYANPQMHYLFSSPLFIHMSSDAPPLSAITTTEHSTTTITGHGTRKRPRTTTTTTKTMTMTPYALRHWEMLPEPTPHVSANDTSLSLALFAARRA
ncbi:MAG: RNA polymerase II mediator complex subunit, partial [Thelocarpon superellum]